MPWRNWRSDTERWLQDQAPAGNLNYGPAGIGSEDGRHGARAEGREQGERTRSKDGGRGARREDGEQGERTSNKD